MHVADMIRRYFIRNFLEFGARINQCRTGFGEFLLAETVLLNHLTLIKMIAAKY